MYIYMCVFIYIYSLHSCTIILVTLIVGAMLKINQEIHRGNKKPFM